MYNLFISGEKQFISVAGLCVKFKEKSQTYSLSFIDTTFPVTVIFRDRTDPVPRFSIGPIPAKYGGSDIFNLIQYQTEKTGIKFGNDFFSGL